MLFNSPLGSPGAQCGVWPVTRSDPTRDAVACKVASTKKAIGQPPLFRQVVTQPGGAGHHCGLYPLAHLPFLLGAGQLHKPRV